MGKRRLLSGVIIGAISGGAIALLDKDTREYAKVKLNDLKTTSSQFVQNPTEGIENLRQTVDRFNQTFTSGVDNTINALEQVEDTISKFTNKN